MSFIIPGESEQIALIEHMEAESVPATPFAFSVPQEVMDDILRTGGNTTNHRLILAAEFSKGKPVEEMTQILRQVYHGGNGMVTEHGRISAWYAEDGIRFAPGGSARYTRIAQVMSWEDAARRIGELLESGQTDVIFASRQNYSFCDWTPLYNEKMYAILPKDYPLNGRTTFPLEEFSGQDFLMPYGRFDIDVNAAMDSVGVKLNASVSRVDDETVIRMVGHGLGVTMMTELMIRGRTDDVLCVPVDPPRLRELGMGTSRKMKLTDGMQSLKDCMLQFIHDRL